MDSSFLDTLLALAAAGGGWKGWNFVSGRWAARNGPAAVNDIQKENASLDRVHDDFERLHEGVEKLLAAQQTTNQILSEVKGRLAQRGD